MSDEERILGAEKMEKELMKVFSSAGKTIKSFKWIPSLSDNFSSFEYHTVEITAGNELYVLENIPREVLEDYPGKVGNEIINFYISKIISVSHIDLKKVHNGSFLL